MCSVEPLLTGPKLVTKIIFKIKFIWFLFQKMIRGILLRLRIENRSSIVQLYISPNKKSTVCMFFYIAFRRNQTYCPKLFWSDFRFPFHSSWSVVDAIVRNSRSGSAQKIVLHCSHCNSFQSFVFPNQVNLLSDYFFNILPPPFTH